MFRFFDKFAYIVVAILLLGTGYKYIIDHNVKIKGKKVVLPYAEEVLALERIVSHKLDKLIKRETKKMKSSEEE